MKKRIREDFIPDIEGAAKSLHRLIKYYGIVCTYTPSTKDSGPVIEFSKDIHTVLSPCKKKKAQITHRVIRCTYDASGVLQSKDNVFETNGQLAIRAYLFKLLNVPKIEAPTQNRPLLE